MVVTHSGIVTVEHDVEAKLTILVLSSSHRLFLPYIIALSQGKLFSLNEIDSSFVTDAGISTDVKLF
jgi:hypothetical protein